MGDATIVLPSLGEAVEQATIVAVLVEPGDRVELDTPILEVATDKVDTEVPATVAGVVAEVRVQPDDVVAPGDALLVVAPGGEATDPSDDVTTGVTPAPAIPAPAAAAPAGTVAPASASPAPAAAERVASRRAAAPAPQVPVSDGHPPLLSPVVRGLLRRYGIELEGFHGSGKGGRATAEDLASIVERDRLRPIERAARASGSSVIEEPLAPPPAVEPAPPTAAPATAGPTTLVPPTAGTVVTDRSSTRPLPRRRRLVATRMRESLAATAQLTSVVDADVTSMMLAMREHRDLFANRWGTKLTPLPFITRATCLALGRHPLLNAVIDLDAGTITEHGHVNLGVAVDTPGGLVVPNIKDAASLTVGALARRISEAATRARDGGLRPDDVKGGTFTITSTGSRGSLLDTPILNTPEVAILAATKIERRPTVVATETGESIAVRDRTYLCLSYDHQLVDGADAARFLTDLARTLEVYDWDAELR